MGAVNKESRTQLFGYGSNQGLTLKLKTSAKKMNE